MSNPTLATKILEEDLKNRGHIRIVVIQQEEMLHKKQYYGFAVNKNPSPQYKPTLAVKQVDTSKSDQNKNLKCEKCGKQGHETSM